MFPICDIEQVRLHLLTAAMKCFFKRAPETQKALGIALAAGIADFHQVSSYLPFQISLVLKPLAYWITNSTFTVGIGCS